MGADAADINNDTHSIDIVTLDMLPEINERKKRLLFSFFYELNGMNRTIHGGV
jgi:hypothetical protein